MFGRQEPIYVAFDVLFVDGEDVRALPLKERKTLLEKVVRRHRLQRSEPVLGESKAAFKAVCDLDLEGIVANRLTDAYGPTTRWWKIVNPGYSQKKGRPDCSSGGTDNQLHPGGGVFHQRQVEFT
jgi:ATP-dependent DNA ligase